MFIGQNPMTILGKGQWKLVFRHWRRPVEAWCWIGRKRNNTSPTVSLCPLNQHLQLFQKKLDKVMNVKAQLYPEKMATLNILPERPRIGFSILREHWKISKWEWINKDHYCFLSDWAWIIKLEYLFSVKTFTKDGKCCCKETLQVFSERENRQPKHCGANDCQWRRQHS